MCSNRTKKRYIEVFESNRNRLALSLIKNPILEKREPYPTFDSLAMLTLTHLKSKNLKLQNTCQAKMKVDKRI